MSLQNIKDSYAKVQHYDNWDSLLNKQESLANIEWHYNNIIELAQIECLKLASENAWNGYIVTGMQEVADDVKESITNENNIIK